jgi:hypothetical protein
MSVLYKDTYFKLDPLNIKPIKNTIKLKSSLPFLSKNLITPPATLDLRPWLQPVRWQGKNGACIPFALACIMEYQAKITNVFNGYLSPWFIHVVGSMPGQDCKTGMMWHKAFDVLMNYGVACEYNFISPYECTFPDISKISECVFLNAKNFRISSYNLVSSIDEMKVALTNFGPVIASFDIYNSSTQPWSPVTISCFERGSHAMVIVGYDSKSFIVRNSWGKDWGNGGYTNLDFNDYKYIKFAYSLTNLNGDTKYRSTSINMLSIITYVVISMLIIILLAYGYNKRLYNLSLFDFTYWYGRYTTEIIFFIMLIITTVLMANMSGMNAIFIVNLTIIFVFILKILVNLFIQYFMKNV